MTLAELKRTAEDVLHRNACEDDDCDRCCFDILSTCERDIAAFALRVIPKLEALRAEANAPRLGETPEEDMLMSYAGLMKAIDALLAAAEAES